MAHSVLAVANQFLSRGMREVQPLTPMHLQKLCYFAHGFSLALKNERLVRDQVQAWDFGPVFPELYNALRKYGSSPVADLIYQNNWATSPKIRGEVVSDRFPEDETDLIGDVFNTYADFEAFQLSALTHEEGSPWEQIYKPGRKNLAIPDQLIRTYFRNVVGQP